MGMFDEMLDRKAEDVKAPPLLPVGTYTVRVKKHPDIVDKEEFEIVEFQLEAMEADNVDPVELEEYGKVQGFPLRMSFLFPKDPERKRDNESALNRLKTFMSTLGVPEDGSIREMMAQTPNTQCLAEVIHVPDKTDPEVVYANIRKVYSL